MATIKMNNNGAADPNLALLLCPPPSPPQSPPAVFSEMEKMAPAAEVEEAEERCSALWNQIKDASVLRGPELTDSLLVNLQLRADFLAQQIEQFDEQQDFCAGAFTNAQLRLACVRSALEQLRRRKTQADAEEEAAAYGQQKRGVQLAQFRKWLLWQQAELARIRQRIPRSRNSLASLRELEAEQKALQEQIQTEGRTKHQQLCNSNTNNNSSEEQRSGFLAKSDSKEVQHTEALEQRYLALWLSSLESLEIIDHFKARLEKKCLADLTDHQQLEEGPDPKRRRTLANQQQLELQKVTNNNSHWTPEQMTTDLEQHPHLAVPSKAATVFGDAGGRKLGQRAAGLGSDIGYSSGENNSLHEGTTNTKSIEESAREMLSSVEEGSHVPQPWAEQIAQSSELEKSFYRTVPLDEFGMTDLDTDDGQHQWPSCLAQKFMDEMEKGGPGLELTDSLIVHVDSPESRQLNDFEEVMDLLDQQQTEPGNRRPEWPVFSEDDLESLSSAADTGRRPPMPRHPQSSATATPGSRKRTLVANRTPMTTTPADQSSKLAADSSTPRRKKQQQQQQSGSARRKWAAVRKHRSSAADVFGNGLNNSYVSSEFEWDEDFPMAGKVSMLGGQRAGRGAAKQIELGDELPDIDVGSPPFLLARKKALAAFRDGLRQAAADSGNVSARLQQLLALVDKSLGGVDSAAYLLAELRATFGSLSSLCQTLESKMATFGQQQTSRGEENKENFAAGKWTRSAGHMKDIIESELMLCHERMNALETTCNNLALLLGTHIGDGNSKCKSAEKMASEEDRDYLAQFASECNRIREEVLKLKSKFGEKFVFCSIQLPSNGKTQLEQRVLKVADCSAQTSSAPMAVAHRRSPAQREGSFWRSYLLLCLLGFVASLGTMLYTQSRESTDWRWSFGPQLHYENGPPPF